MRETTRFGAGRRVLWAIVGILALSVATAVATPPKSSTKTDLARSTIAGPITVSATAESDLAFEMVTLPPGGIIPWHSHPGAFLGAVKSGTLTLYRGGAQGCTKQSYSAGQGYLDPAGDVHYAKNEGSTPAEIYATYVAVPVGAELLKTEANPGGANCLSESAGPEVTVTDLARSKIAGPINVQTTGATDVAMQAITVEPGGTTGWHSHPASDFVAVKSGTLTLYHGSATRCTSESHSAGQGHFGQAGDVHVARNEGTTPVELYVTFLGAPVGGELFIDQPSPDGASCPDPNPVAKGPSQLPRTGGTGPGVLLAVLGVGLAGAGTAARLLARRR